MIPAEGAGAPVVVERHFGVDRPEVMRKWLAEMRADKASPARPGQEDRMLHGVLVGARPPVGTPEFYRWRAHKAGMAAKAATTPKQRRRWARAGGKARWARARAAARRGLAPSVGSPGRMITVPAAALLCERTPEWVYAAIRTKQLQATSDGRGKIRVTGLRVPLNAVLALMDQRAAASPKVRLYVAVTLFDGPTRKKYVGLTLPVGNGLAGPEQIISVIKQKFNGGGR